MDADGYPTDDELEKIRQWDYSDFGGLLQWISVNCWWPKPDCGFKQTGRKFRLATGGWSGNEEVIEALSHNMMFNALCWQSSHRGGLHVYVVPKLNISRDAKVCALPSGPRRYSVKAGDTAEHH